MHAVPNAELDGVLAEVMPLEVVVTVVGLLSPKDIRLSAEFHAAER